MPEHLNGLSVTVSSIPLRSKEIRRSRNGLVATMIACRTLPLRTSLTKRDKNVARALSCPPKASQGVKRMENFGRSRMNRIMAGGMEMLLVGTVEDQAGDGIIPPILRMPQLQVEAERRRRRKRRIVGRGLRMLIHSRKRALGERRRKRRANQLREMVILILDIVNRQQISPKMQKADSTVVERAEGNQRRTEMAMGVSRTETISSPTSFEDFYGTLWDLLIYSGRIPCCFLCTSEFTCTIFFRSLIPLLIHSFNIHPRVFSHEIHAG